MHIRSKSPTRIYVLEFDLMIIDYLLIESLLKTEVNELYY